VLFGGQQGIGRTTSDTIGPEGDLLGHQLITLGADIGFFKTIISKYPPFGN